MSKYDKIRAAYSAYNAAAQNYINQNQFLTFLIVDGLHDYLGMPRSFQTSEEPGKYTTFFSVEDDGSAKLEDRYVDALTHLSNGSFKFAFGIILESSENSYPKNNLIMQVECERKEHTVVVNIDDQSREISFDGQNYSDIETVHELIFNLIIEWLEHRPGDGSSFSNKIGFAIN